MSNTKLWTIRKDFIPFWFCSFIFICIAALRGKTRDTDAYLFVYKNINSFPLDFKGFYDSTGMEIGYGYIASFFYNLNAPFFIFLFFISFITFFFIKKASNNLGTNAFFVLLAYLPVFFANHQLMQIRQGLAVAAAYCALSYFINNKAKILGWLSFIFGFIFHNVILIFIFFFFNKINKFILTDKINLFIKCFLIVISVVVLCRILTDYGLIQLTDRVSTYTDSIYSEDRPVYHPANLRSLLLLVIFVYFRPKSKEFTYDFLTILYAIGVGFRLGFYDFLILSGRLSTIFTFSEIFLIPMLLKFKFNQVTSFFLMLFYVIINLYITIVYQVPFIFEDYFRPL